MVASTPVTGSSSRYRSGAAANARARKTRLPLAAGQLPDLAVAFGRHRHGLEGLRHRLAVGRARSAPDADRRVPTHHHDLADRDREAPVDELRLGHVGDPAGGLARWAAQHLDRPRPDRQQPRDDLEQRALARAVGSDDREQRPAPDGEADVLEGDAVPVSRADTCEPDGVVGHGRSASTIPAMFQRIIPR